MSSLNVNYESKLAGAKGLLVLFGSFFVLIVVASLIASSVNGLDFGDRNRLLISSAVQGVIAFFLPAWLAARVSSGAPARLLGLESSVPVRTYLGVVIAFAIGLPAINQIIVWNEGMHLPESMGAVEKVLRQWEEANGGVAEKLLSTDTVWGLVSGILVVGLLTGFCEEIFFRGALQRMFGMCGLGSQWSVWLAAFIFSAVHFQFFGFVPRLLLGAFFGYLFLYSDSIWPGVVAHALNNSIVVVSYWLISRGVSTSDAGSIGVASDGSFPWVPLASAVALAIFFIFSWRYFFSINHKMYGKNRESGN